MWLFILLCQSMLALRVLTYYSERADTTAQLHCNQHCQITLIILITSTSQCFQLLQIINGTRRRSEGAYIHQVHDNVMMYTSTCLHTCLHSNVRVPMTMTSSIMTACCGMCGKSIGNGVNIFVHFSSNPSSILNLTISSESQYNDVSNDISSV